MAINFPATGGQATDGSYTYTVAGIVYAWNGSSWEAAGAGASATDRTLFSVTTNAAGTPALSYTSATGVFEYTPPLIGQDTLNDVVGRGNVVIGQDVNFGDYTGATGAPKIQYVDSNSTLWFKPSSVGADSAKIDLGGGISYENLSIQTTASLGGSLIAHNQNLFLGTYTAGYNIILQSGNDIYLQNAGVDAIKVLENGQTNGDALSVELYWGSTSTGGKKLETTTNGVTITGQLTAGGLAYPTTNGTSGYVITSDGGGNAAWAPSTGLQSRQTESAAGTVANGGVLNTTFSAHPAYALMKIETSHAAWVTLYTSSNARTNDATRNETTDPTPGSGVLAEVITTGAVTQSITPATICFNESGVSTTYAKIVNKSGSTVNLTVTLTYLKLEA